VNSDQEFAEGVYKILTAFMVGIESIDGLEDYYKKNISAIHAVKSTDPKLYEQLINKFKEERHAIDTHQVRQSSVDKTAGRKRQSTTEQENENRRTERTRLYTESHPSARFWKR
jgi:hypothetical protein|tara:strand:+ start:616 stop:957 length:342 start_codon:yes stop_codon:yes gene_type:complete